MYGVLSYVCAFSEKMQETRAIHPADIVYPIGSTLYRAAFLLRETTMNLFIRVSLEDSIGYTMITDQDDRRLGALKQCHSIENHIEAEKYVPRETLKTEFKTHVTDLVRQLMRAFDWADDRAIVPWVGKIVDSEWQF